MATLRSFSFNSENIGDPIIEFLISYLLIKGCKLSKIDDCILEVYEALIFDKMKNKVDWDNVYYAFITENVEEMEEEIKKVRGYIKGIRRNQEKNKKKNDWKNVPICEDETDENGVSEATVTAYVQQRDEYEAFVDKMDAEKLLEKLYQNREKIKETYGFDVIEELKEALKYYMKSKKEIRRDMFTPKCILNLLKLKKDKDVGQALHDLLELGDSASTLLGIA